MDCARRIIRKGDILQFPDENGYSHYGIYTGTQEVYHVAPDEGLPSGCRGLMKEGLKAVAWSTGAKIARDDLELVAADRPFFVHNLLDHECKPRNVEEYMAEAESMVGKTYDYNIMSSNCEHFVTKLRYGVERSLQGEIPNATTKVNGVVMGTTATALAAAKGAGAGAVVWCPFGTLVGVFSGTTLFATHRMIPDNRVFNVLVNANVYLYETYKCTKEKLIGSITKKEQ